MKTDSFVFFLDSSIANVKVLDELVDGRMTGDPPVALVVVRMLVKPKPADKIVQISLGKSLPVFVDVHIRIGNFIVSYNRPSAETA